MSGHMKYSSLESLMEEKDLILEELNHFKRKVGGYTEKLKWVDIYIERKQDDKQVARDTQGEG